MTELRRLLIQAEASSDLVFAVVSIRKARQQAELKDPHEQWKAAKVEAAARQRAAECLNELKRQQPIDLGEIEKLLKD